MNGDLHKILSLFIKPCGEKLLKEDLNKTFLFLFKALIFFEPRKTVRKLRVEGWDLRWGMGGLILPICLAQL